MFRKGIIALAWLTSFPRIRGDVPARSDGGANRCKFSPHTRGCSFSAFAYHGAAIVFPAYAGMFRGSDGCYGEFASFPRIRGDVPDVAEVKNAMTGFSPHTRGCSAGLGDS